MPLLEEIWKGGPARTIFDKDWRRKHPVATGVIIFIFFLLGMFCYKMAYHPSGSDGSSHAPSRPGYGHNPQVQAYLHTTGSKIYVAATRDVEETLMAATAEAARTGIVDPELADMLRSGEIFSVPNGTPVEILDRAGQCVKVRILDGAAQGQGDWVPSDAISGKYSRMRKET